MKFRLTWSVLIALTWSVAAAAAEAPKRVDVPAGELTAALELLSKQAAVDLVFQPDQLRSFRTEGVKGAYSVEDAIRILLKGTRLQLRKDAPSGAMVIALPGVATSSTARSVGKQNIQLALAEGESQHAQKANDGGEDESADSNGTPEILVKGSRSLNTDIQRTADDPQPYVVFDKQEIERSQAVNLEGFLRTRLPMNASAGGYGQKPGASESFSGTSINLRGLGTSQTLVLVDGRRMPETGYFGGPFQSDINGIPLAAVERVEVLPSTAGGIYGGSATGGVINIILRRGYRGLEASATYGNTFDAVSDNARIDLNAGFSLEGGRTQVMLTGSHSEADTLRLRDRDLYQRAFALQKANNPNVAAWTTSSTPPVGATVNIRSADGSPLVLDQQYGGTALVSSVTGQPTNITHIPLGYAGPASDGGQALLRNAGTYNLDIPNDMSGLQEGLMAVPTMDSVSMNVKRDFGNRVNAFLDLSRLGNRGTTLAASPPHYAFDLEAGAPNNPFQQALNVSFPSPEPLFAGIRNHSATTTVRALGGVIVRLAHQWTGEVDYSWSRAGYQGSSMSSNIDGAALDSLSTGLAAADGRPALNALQEQNTYPIDWTPYLLPTPNYIAGPWDSVLKDATLRLSGPTLQLGGGPLTLSGLVEHRDTDFKAAIATQIDSFTRNWYYNYYPGKSQQVDSFYLEARAPLVSVRNARPGLRGLEMQVSARRDEYQTRGVNPRLVTYLPSPDAPLPPLTYVTGSQGSTNYTVALKYTPVQMLTMRMSIGTGFLPPSVLQIAPNVVLATTANYGPDPKRGNTPMNAVPFDYYYNGSANLQPENSRSWSAGVIFTPALAPELRLSVDYTDIKKTDEVTTPSAQFMLDNEDLFPGRIVRGAKLAGDAANWAGPIIKFDLGPINVAGSELEAYDIQADYTVRTERFGTFHGYSVATWEPHYQKRTLPGQALVEYVGYNGGLSTPNPLEWRGNAGLSWERGALSVEWNAQYYAAYRVYAATASAGSRTVAIASQGAAWIPSQLYHDLFAMYKFSHGGGMLADTEISVGIQNVFDTSPPIIASSTLYPGGYSTYGDPRMRRYTLSVRKSFNW